ncbi:2-amino-4-hydroxy-6-hydroxymethyldihydropteridine diphosphokinase [Candidatus Kaiserbacteria bacterium RIFCSPHIGHO2_02_FULL_55_20]|uniref:2-amino-4-hydroxy-6-hydroxymethyldihydropteridine diphosphokinase n=1 Tax=Candidatus Kaiserbacteria bacterium RIFCSPHIGHO2_02_FULL_55_20 TaxID=1798497 RepID=A0A1F6DXF5_9BACT|nr:MAG: 2-amino-4-hydroxy-6-hydroxymethyldihydropteridine diphosphokinase [Candidatus Kaiserbacteria bacterium RIFCSPHIGHO2_01_FULL_55_37]OGG66109.1 MAG: 2-amino-4-hydroxy-6-hydroxymethyldihydropteridine diphosphokinase [Candidatus Kaiserbacteria bacterium RIFCSPHIGHO2_02_FULL_55_20]
MTTIYLGLGSNLGDRAGNIKRALAALAPEITVTKVSPTYETRPMYVTDQPDFFNAVCEATTELSAADVLRKIKAIEKEMGEHKHNAPRSIDIDLLLYGSGITDTPELTLPHAGLRERDFVLKPLCDITPELLDPVTGKTVSQLLDGLPPDRLSVIGPVPEVS